MRVSSKDNPRFKQVRSLQQRKYREKYGQFLLEGERAVAALAANGTAAEIWQAETYRGEAAVASATARYIVPDEMFAQLAETEHAQGILAVVRQSDLPTFPAEPNGNFLVLAGVQDPGNAGTLLRLAAAVGCRGVIATKGTVDLFNAKTVRSSMGALLTIPVLTNQEPAEWLAKARQYGLPVLATALQNSVPYTTMPGTTRGLWVFGNEGSGLSEEWLAGASARYCIPMAAGTDSLNVAIAAAVFLFHNRFLTEGAHGD